MRKIFPAPRRETDPRNLHGGCCSGPLGKLIGLQVVRVRFCSFFHPTWDNNNPEPGFKKMGAITENGRIPANTFILFLSKGRNIMLWSG
jgi:hypothetical protein